MCPEIFSKGTPDLQSPAERGRFAKMHLPLGWCVYLSFSVVTGKSSPTMTPSSPLPVILKIPTLPTSKGEYGNETYKLPPLPGIIWNSFPFMITGRSNSDHIAICGQSLAIFSCLSASHKVAMFGYSQGRTIFPNATDRYGVKKSRIF